MIARKIAVLFHENDRRRLASYAITYLADFWRRDGHRVDFLFGIRERVPADLVVVHVDRSVVPDEYLDFARRYPIALNGSVTDIRKSAISANLLRPGDAYEGAVIVKSNLNDGGAPERERRSRWKRLLRRRDRDEPAFRTSQDYRVYRSLAELPPDEFARSDRVIEKFLPEFADAIFFVRHYEFLGDRATCTRLAARTPIVKDRNVVRTEEVEPDPEIVEARRRLEFDYGKFDYTIHDGRAVLLDANKTTGADRFVTPELEARRRRRAEGLYAYFR